MTYKYISTVCTKSYTRSWQDIRDYNKLYSLVRGVYRLRLLRLDRTSLNTEVSTDTKQTDETLTQTG